MVYTMGENSPMTLTQQNLYSVHFAAVLKMIILLTYLISCQHVEKRNIEKALKFHCCSSKTEGDMNF